MSPAAILLVMFLALGLLLRLLAAWMESRVLRGIWKLLQQPDEGEGSRTRETALERAGVGLSLVKLARLLSLLFLLPGLWTAIQMLPAVWKDDPAKEFLLLLAAALLAGIFLALFPMLAMRGFYSGPPQPAGGNGIRPRWLVDATQEVPGPIQSAAMLWEWLMGIGEVLVRPLKLERSHAHLVEQEDGLLMIVGGAEETLPLRDDPEKHEHEQSRTERDMIRAIQRLDETLVREVMRPLNNVTAVPLGNLTPEKFLALARRTGYTRFPCYYDQVTNLIGYLNVHDFLERPVLPKDIRQLVHPALFIPEVARVDAALQEMLRTRNQIAICFDEFGGCSGLLSREDIIEEITGEIMDEYDRPALKIQKILNHYLVDGVIDLDDLEESLGLVLPRENCDTLAGYVYHRLSRIPRRGEGFEEGGWRIVTAQLEGHRIRRLRLFPPGENGEPEEGPPADGPTTG